METSAIETPTVQTEQITQQLRDAIEEVVLRRGNAKARKLFFAAVKDLKINHCVSKVGWVSGRYITFHCIFYKGGEGELFEEIAKGVEKKVEMLNFIYGLNPKIFHFDPVLFSDKPEKLYVGFKLKRDGEE